MRPMLVGQDDVHLVRDGGAGVLPAPVSVVISTRIKPGQEAAYRAWEQRIAAAQTKAPGFQGYRFEPPIPGVQDDWLAIAALRQRGQSPGLARLAGAAASCSKEAEPFTEEFHARIVRTGFEQWFPSRRRGAAPPAWKQNMIVLLLLYPVVFLFGTLRADTAAVQRLGLPFAIALFVGNVVSVVLLNYLVPWTSMRFSWWLRPAGPNPARTDAGSGARGALYAVMLVAFWRLF